MLKYRFNNTIDFIKRFLNMNRDRIAELEQELDECKSKLTEAQGLIEYAKKLNGDLRDNILEAERINDDFTEHLKTLMKDIDDLHLLIAEKDKIIQTKDNPKESEFTSDVPFDEVRAPWMIKADNLHKELDATTEKLKVAEEAIHLKDTEITLLKNKVHQEKVESVYCTRLGFYCTPQLREMEW